MKKQIFGVLLFIGIASAVQVEAARAPELFVNATTGSTVAQVSIMDADGNAPATLYYQASGATHSVSIGTTNAGGNLNTPVDAAQYGIGVGSQVYVVVNGASSPFSTWPDYANGGSLPLNPTSLVLVPGQTSVVTASVSADLSVGSNSAPNVASANINGNQISVRAIAAGSDTISICASGLGCSSLAVNVTSTSGTNVTPATFSISTDMGNGSEVTLALGQNLTVPLLGSQSKIFSISSNPSPTIIGASANGPSLYLTGLAYGGSNIQICEFEGQCANVYVYVPTPSVAAAPIQSSPTPVSAATPTPTPVTASHAVFTSYLKPGSSGTQVRALQTILAKLGLLKHVVTGFYGTLTTDAVAALQKKRGLAALGVVGPATRALLNSMSQ